MDVSVDIRGGKMKEFMQIILNCWCAGMVGFFVGMLLMFILSCLHHAQIYDDMIDKEDK